MILNEGKDFINVLINCIWAIDLFIDIFRERCFVMLILFENFLGYYVFENYKYKKSELSRLILFFLVGYLDVCLEKFWIFKVMWVFIKVVI